MNKSTPTPAAPARHTPRWLWAYSVFITLICIVLAVQSIALRREMEQHSARFARAHETGGSGAVTVGEQVHALTATAVRTGPGPARPLDAQALSADDPLAFTDSRAATLCIAVTAACDLCEHSLPSYRALADTFTGSGIRFVAIQLDAINPEDLKSDATPALPFVAVQSPVETWLRRIPIVPAAIVIDGKGAVRRTYFGTLSPDQQADLHALLTSIERGEG